MVLRRNYSRHAPAQMNTGKKKQGQYLCYWGETLEQGEQILIWVWQLLPLCNQWWHQNLQVLCLQMFAIPLVELTLLYKNCEHNSCFSTVMGRWHLMLNAKYQVYSTLQKSDPDQDCCGRHLAPCDSLKVCTCDHYKDPILNNIWQTIQTDLPDLNCKVDPFVNLSPSTSTQATAKTNPCTSYKNFTIHYWARCQQHLPGCRLHHTVSADSVAAETMIHHVKISRECQPSPIYLWNFRL